jgi:serine protease Do
MLQDVHLSFRGGTMMLFAESGGEVTFMGSAFLVHSDGYLLTCAHILYRDEGLMLLPPETPEVFQPMRTKTVSPLPARIVSVDKEHDVALLKFEEPLDITVPDHVIGVPEAVPVGSSVATLGYSFGFHHVYNQMIQQAVVSSKILSRNDTRLLLIDSMVHDGTRGGPLVSIRDGRVIGVISGIFEPSEAAPGSLETKSVVTNISYAVSIDYAVDLMEAEGVEVI